MATSYRKSSMLDSRDILVFDKVPEPPKRRITVDKAPALQAPPKLHAVKDLLAAFRQLPQLRNQNLQPGESFTLSPRQAWIDDRGWVDAFNCVVVAPDEPNFQFVRGIGNSDEARQVDIWLKNLIPGRSYLAQVRLQAGDGGQFHIGTGEGTHQTAPGGDRVVPVLLFQVQRELSLIRIENHGAYYWAFVDVQITALEPI